MNYSISKTDDGIELVVNTKTNQAYATQAGYVRMSGKPKMTISDRIKGVRDGVLETAEIQTAGGLQGVRLIPASLVFEWMMRDNIELAIAPSSLIRATTKRQGQKVVYIQAKWAMI